MLSSILSSITQIIRKNRIELLIASLTVLVLLINFLDFPFQGEIYYAYNAQEFLRGRPFFSTNVAVKPIVSYLVDAILMSVFYFVEDFWAIRIGMLILSCLSMILFYRVIREITEDDYFSLICVLILLSFTYFIQDSLNSGLKPLILLFSSVQTLLLFRKRYFWASVFAGLSFMTWQPTGLLITGPIVYAFLKKEDLKTYGKILVGFILPAAIIVLYFLYHGLLAHFVEYAFVKILAFNISRTNPIAWIRFYGIVGYYNTELFFLLLGVLGLVPLWKKYRTNSNFLAYSIPFMLILIYSIFDFQGSDDVIVLFPLIVPAAVMWLLDRKLPAYLTILFIGIYGFLPYLQNVNPENPLITVSKEANNINELFDIVTEFGLGKAFYYGAFHRKGEEMTLEHQLQIARYIKDNTEEDEMIFSMGAPEIAFLSERTSLHGNVSTPYNADSVYLTAEYYKWVNGTRIGEIFKEKLPNYVVSRNVWMNEKVIDSLGIGQELDDYYNELDGFNEEYVVWERKTQ